MSDFTVNLQDPESVDQALARARAFLLDAEKRHAAAEIELANAAAREKAVSGDVERWKALAFTLQSAGNIMAAVQPQLDEAEANKAEADPTSKDMALQVVTIINGPATIPEVAEHMPQFDRKTVSWALWKLAGEKVIQKVSNGLYAPRGYKVGTPTTNYFNAPPGFAAPSAAQINEAVATAKLEARAERGGHEDT
jgi:hypothetical protein